MRRPLFPTVRRSLSATRLALAAAALASCIAHGHPLSSSGNVDVRIDIATPLFAVGRIDSKGVPTGTRQEPHQTAVTLYMTEDGQPAWGAYTEVRVDPPEALVMKSDPTEKAPSCVPTNGVLRCTSTDQGYARLLLSSEGQWSGPASLLVTWGGNPPKSSPITVLPAGLPQDTTGFALLVGGLDQTNHVLATYAALTCTTDNVPDTLGSAWRPGAIRARQATVVAATSPTEPGALANAPVLIQSLNAEGALSLTADCADKSRVSKLAVQLGSGQPAGPPLGQSPPFYLCFSDNGGTIRFAITSGQKAIDPAPQVVVDPEPRLLRVRSLLPKVAMSLSPIDLFEVSAYNADRARIAMPVDVVMADSTVLALDIASVTLAEEPGTATVIHATPLMAGMTGLHVRPRLFAMPDCASSPVNVEATVTGVTVNGCDSTMVLAAAGDVTIQFPLTSMSQQYSPACVKVHTGATVTWLGSFPNHPLAPGPQGDPNNPILLTSIGTSVSFNFPTNGSFGFHSTSDPTAMAGAVFVVP